MQQPLDLLEYFSLFHIPAPDAAAAFSTNPFGCAAAGRNVSLSLTTDRRTDKNERVYFNLGMLAMDDKNIEEAENWFKRAVHLKQDFRSALFNLALLLADDDRPLEAAPFLNQLVKYHPDHIKGLILLGDIYINNIKDLDAAENVIEFLNLILVLDRESSLDL